MIKRNNELGEAIKKRLKKLDVRQSDLANKVGCDWSAMCRMINGKRHIPDDLRKAIGQALGMDLSDLAQVRGAANRGVPAITEVGILIRDALAKKGITQTQLCRELTLDAAVLSNIIHGRRKITESLRLELSALLEVELPRSKAANRRIEDITKMSQRIDSLEAKVDQIIIMQQERGDHDQTK